MSFLDNLESNLKSLEETSQRNDPSDRQRKQKDREDAIAAAPFAEQLRKGSFTMGLLDHTTRIGFEKRTKVNIAWIGTSLLLTAKERRLELRPTGAGVRALFSESGEEKGSEIVDLAGDPSNLASRWLN